MGPHLPHCLHPCPLPQHFPPSRVPPSRATASGAGLRVSPMDPMAVRLMATAWDGAKSCDPFLRVRGQGYFHGDLLEYPTGSIRWPRLLYYAFFWVSCIWASPYEDYFFFFCKQSWQQTMGGLSTFSQRLSLLSLRGHEGSKTSGHFILSMKQMAGKWGINQRRY